MPSTSYSQTGPFRYDYAIAGIPFLSAASEQYPYTRQTAQNRREQINTSRDVGEQSLDGWWYRSQSSFHMGAGLKYFDTITSDSASFRFEDSAGVNVWTPGEVSHLRTTSNSLAAASGFAYSFSSEGIGSGEDGYIYADRTNNIIYWKNINGTTGSFTFTAENVFDVADDGIYVYVLTAGGIWRIANMDNNTTRTATKIYSRTTTRGRMAYIKDRLVVIANRNIYALGTSPSGTPVLGSVEDPDPTKISAIYQLPDGYRGYDLADGPNAIYLLAGSEETSFVYAFTISNDDNTSLNAPVTVLEAPRGETFLSFITYIGTYMVIGSTLGVRVGVIAGDSSVVLGPLTVKSDGPVRALFAMRDFVWAGGANVDGKYGLYRLNLATPLEADNLIFPYAKDLATGVSWTGSTNDYIQSIARFGKSDRLVFSLRRNSIGDTGCGVYEEGTSLLTTGWLRTGRVRMDTTQPKVFYRMTTIGGGTAGSVQTIWVNEAGTEASVDTNTISSGYASKEFAASTNADPRLWAQYRFVLTRTGGGTFQFQGYQLRVNPSQVKRRLIQVPLLCMATETGPNGRAITRNVWQRINQLEKFEELGETVVFQDFATGEQRNCLIEEIQFVSTHIPDNYKQRANAGGILLVTLRAADATT